ncbi:menaquinone biosynthesis protein [Pedobacter sp. SD-b]|uniref:Chorismate dehydratase n=1 Tax=Pedobacter segetis TaxID=2793069 RepID=A0ABS1BMH7_9SPHI|nr:menaquinone biosynthesis protein [Pedobacter segetis]MBK0384008.1 menaquinone biosynthesis protein [Pedobacter segetis]
MIKISAVSYTNTIPFIFGLQHHPIKKDIILSLDVPSLCAQKLIEDKVDIGLIPVAAIIDLPEHHIISDYCIGANGQVNSVFIFSNCPIKDVKYLQLDPQSKSSNNLALVLLKNYWKVQPELVEKAKEYGRSPHPNTAFVQIGDRTFGKVDQHSFVYDLAAEWKNFTGLEFVFAAWVSNKKLDDAFIHKLNQALKLGLDSRLEIFENMDMRKDFDLVDYLMHKIDYRLTDNKKEALKLFHRLMSELD